MNFLKSYNPIILTSCALALSACGPVYRTNYNLLPPPTQQGQLCANNVKLMSDTCVNNCQMMARNCRSFGPGLSVGYGWGNTWGPNTSLVAGGSPLNDSDRDCSPRQCEESCLASARTAHQSCGGTITQETVCTANCPTAPVPATPQP